MASLICIFLLLLSFNVNCMLCGPVVDFSIFAHNFHKRRILVVDDSAILAAHDYLISISIEGDVDANRQLPLY